MPLSLSFPNRLMGAGIGTNEDEAVSHEYVLLFLIKHYICLFYNIIIVIIVRTAIFTALVRRQASITNWGDNDFCEE